MLRPLLAVMMLCVISGTAFAHPNYPGLESRQGSFEVSGRSGAGKGQKAVSESRNGAAIASKYLGTNPTRMRSRWCARFMGLIEKKAGRPGTGSDMALSYAGYGRGVSRSQVRPGDIAVMRRPGCKGCGHVGYFEGWASSGKAILVSGNSRGGKVARGEYATARIIAWRRPS